jgi:ABC-type sugar transport system ATPase subunit
VVQSANPPAATAARLVDAPHHPEPLLVATAIRKSFGGAHALRGVDLVVRRGEVHGLAGENGSGKSTLLKVISGQVRPDAGRIDLDGHEARFTDPARAVAAGISTVTQETTIVPGLSVAENILLGRSLPRRRGHIDWRAARKRAGEVLDLLGLAIDPRSCAGDLAPDQQQMVEIARAISRDARVLILDEPTSHLPDDEVEALFRVMSVLRGAGVGIVFVSHRMKEVFAVVDRLTVLRDGQVVAGGPAADFDHDRLVHAMVGRKPAVVHPTPAPAERRTALRVRGLHVPGHVHDFALDVAEGEVVGLTGLVGSGRSEVLDAVFGAGPRAAGHVEVAGEPFDHRTPARAAERGIAYVPNDRKRLGLVLDASVQTNLVMAVDAARRRLARPHRRRERAVATAAMERFGVRAASGALAVGRLSGGNQQKVVLAKWMLTDPRVLLLDEPTRGVDVGAKAEIYRLVQRAQADGLAIVVSSSEVPELLLLCNRIVVMHRGGVAATLDRADATEARIAALSMGVP